MAVNGTSGFVSVAIPPAPQAGQNAVQHPHASDPAANAVASESFNERCTCSVQGSSYRKFCCLSWTVVAVASAAYVAYLIAKGEFQN